MSGLKKPFSPQEIPSATTSVLAHIVMHKNPSGIHTIPPLRKWMFRCWPSTQSTWERQLDSDNNILQKQQQNQQRVQVELVSHGIVRFHGLDYSVPGKKRKSSSKTSILFSIFHTMPVGINSWYQKVTTVTTFHLRMWFKNWFKNKVIIILWNHFKCLLRKLMFLSYSQGSVLYQTHCML